MKTKKKSATKNLSKNRLLCVTLPETLLAATQAYRRKSGFSSMSELLRATVDHASAVALKKSAPETKTQISFRLSEPLYTSLFRAANQSGQSIARIIRTLLESAPKLGIRPKGMPEPKKRAVSAKKAAPVVPAKKKAAPAKPVKKSAKPSGVPAKKSAVAAPAKKKPLPVAKKAVPAKKKPAKRK